LEDSPRTTHLVLAVLARLDNQEKLR